MQFRRSTITSALIAITTVAGILSGLASATELPAPPAATDELSELTLEQLMDVPVVAAGRREQSQRQVAAAVSTVTDDDIELFGYRNLADILRAQRGFYLFNDGMNTLVGVRGFLRPGEWNARMLILVDGRSTREVVYGQSNIEQEFTVPIEAIKRVEIIRGPGSAMYGSNAVFGVVNIVTKDGADLQGGELHIQGGTQGTARVSALYGLKTRDDWDFIGNFAGYTSDGDDDIKYDGVDDPEHNFGHIVNSDFEGAYALFLKAKKGDLTATFDLENRQRDNRSAKYYTSFFGPGVNNERRANLTFQIDHQISPGKSIHAMALVGYYGYKESSQYDADPDNGVPSSTYHSRARSLWLSQEIHYDWQVNSSLHLLLGADATESLLGTQKDIDDLTGTVLDANNSYNTVAVFAEAEWQATSWLTLVGGARLDHVQNFGLQFSPRAAAIVRPTDADTLKLMYGRAFRTPNLYEQFYTTPGYLGNTDLDPETVDTFELVWERTFGGGWSSSLGGFIWKMSDSLRDVVTDDGEQQTQNGGRTTAYGVEAEIQRRWENGARLRAHGAATRLDSDDVDKVAHSPQWIAGASVVVPVINRKNFIAFETQLVGQQRSPSGGSTDASYMTNVVFTSRDVGRVKGLDFQAGVYNIFADDSRFPHVDDATFYQPTLNNAPTQLLVGLT